MNGTDRQIRTRLPSKVYDLARHLGAMPSSNRDKIELTQTGRMKLRLDAESWMGFTAAQTISTLTCEFDWQARAGPFGIISAGDALRHGEGSFDIKVLGVIPVARAAKTPALVRGELMRYLAQLAWAPVAILTNTTLHWLEEGPDRFGLAAGENETVCEVILNLDGDGRISPRD